MTTIKELIAGAQQHMRNEAEKRAAEFAEWERSLPGIVRRQAGILPGPPYVQENNDGENK